MKAKYKSTLRSIRKILEKTTNDICKFSISSKIINIIDNTLEGIDTNIAFQMTSSQALSLRNYEENMRIINNKKESHICYGEYCVICNPVFSCENPFYSHETGLGIINIDGKNYKVTSQKLNVDGSQSWEAEEMKPHEVFSCDMIDKANELAKGCIESRKNKLKQEIKCLKQKLKKLKDLDSK